MVKAIFQVSSAFTIGISYVSKLNSSGDFVWAKSMGGVSFDRGNSIVVDAGGNVYTTGKFRSGSIDFDPDTVATF